MTVVLVRVRPHDLHFLCTVSWLPGATCRSVGGLRLGGTVRRQLTFVYSLGLILFVTGRLGLDLTTVRLSLCFIHKNFSVSNLRQIVSAIYWPCLLCPDGSFTFCMLPFCHSPVRNPPIRVKDPSSPFRHLFCCPVTVSLCKFIYYSPLVLVPPSPVSPIFTPILFSSWVVPSYRDPNRLLDGSLPWP